MQVTALLVIFGAAAPASGVPSAATAILAAASPVRYVEAIIVAQADGEQRADRKAEEGALQDDIERARQRLGHGATQNGAAAKAANLGDAPVANAPNAEGAAPDGHLGESAGDHQGHQHDPGSVDRYEHEHGSSDRYRRPHSVRHDVQFRGPATGAYDTVYTDSSRAPRRRVSKYPPGYQPPTYDGHGKAHYLGWGIVDWGVAGGCGVAALVTGLIGAQSWAVAAQNERLNARQAYPFGTPGNDVGTSRVYKRDYRELAVAMAVSSALLSTAAGLMSWRAASNMSTYGELRERQADELRAWRHDEPLTN